MEQTTNSEVHIVCTCPQTHRGWVHHWESFPKEFTWLWDKNNGEEGKGFQYTEKDIIENFNFTGVVSKKHYWNSFGNRNIIWFYAHFRMLNYYLQNPNHDYYWFYDDDVTCNDWEGFLESFKNSKEDFIAHHIFSKENPLKQVRIPVIDDKTTSQHMWFERFPGDGDILPWWIQEYFGSFFPVVRFSNSALHTLLQQFRWGNWGYSEGFVPTILNGYRHSMGTIYQKDGTSNYFDINKIQLKHKHQTIQWDWI